MNRDWSTSIPFNWHKVPLTHGATGSPTSFYLVNTFHRNGNQSTKTRCSGIAVSQLKSPYLNNNLVDNTDYGYCVLTFSSGGRMSRKKFKTIYFLLYSFLQEVKNEDNIFMSLSENKSRILLIYKKSFYTRQLYIILKALRMFWNHNGSDWKNAVKEFCEFGTCNDSYIIRSRKFTAEDVIYNMLQFNEIDAKSPSYFIDAFKKYND